jgi:allophanate hydrolase subunit 1
MAPAASVKEIGEYAWLLEFRDGDERQANARARAAAAVLGCARPKGLLDVIPAARTVYVAGSPAFDPGFLSGLEGTPLPPEEGPDSRLHTIAMTPTGADLPEVAAALAVSVEAFVARFTQIVFTVGFLGFSPGFAYMYGLPPGMELPRRKTPRTAVPAGSVAIAGKYACVYPGATPGGWNLLGTARVTLFDPAAEPPALFSAGDRVRFVAER